MLVRFHLTRSFSVRVGGKKPALYPWKATPFVKAGEAAPLVFICRRLLLPHCFNVHVGNCFRAHTARPCFPRIAPSSHDVRKGIPANTRAFFTSSSASVKLWYE